MSGFYKPKDQNYPLNKRESKETIDQIKQYPFLVNPERGINPKVYEYLGFRMAVDPADGYTPIAAYYPIYKAGKLVGYKKRDYRKSKKECFSIVGQADHACDLIGADKIKPGKRLYITEGEEDLAAVIQTLQEIIKSNPNWKGKIHPNVVSIVSGAPYAAENISNNIEVIERYQEIVTCFDNDKCTTKEYSKGYRRGYEATCDVHLLLGSAKCKYLPFELKDASEYLQRKREKDLLEIIRFGAKEFTPITLEDGNVYSIDDLLEPTLEGTPIASLPKTSALLHGLRDNEMTLLIAPPKSGKSSLSRQIAKDINEADLPPDYKVGNIFLEESGKKTRQAYIALDNKVPLPKFREDPTCIPREDVEASYNKFFKNNKNIFLNTREGKLKPDQVINILRFLFAKGCRRFILDHLSMVVSGSDNTNERKEIDNLLTDMAAFCESNPVHILVVAHITRGNFQPKKDDDGDIIYPYWRTVEVTEARGSGAFEQLFWNAICIEPEILTEDGRVGRVRTKVAFCREWGSKGIGDYLKWNDETGILDPV